MRRLIIGGTFLLSVALGLGLSVSAQPGPPRTYTCEWTQDLIGRAPDSFQILVDGAVAATVPMTACTGTTTLTCSSPLTMTTNVAHTVIVKAINLFGEASSVPFSAAPPGRPEAVVIR
jgi:hypothetical protein